jgi:hypothetical protein
MFIYPYRKAFKSLMFGLALLFALRTSLLAQQSIQDTRSSTQPSANNIIEVASLNPLPTAPGFETLSAPRPIMPAAAIVAAPAGVQPMTSESHRFWDRENTLLFVGVGAAATADFFTTHANLASGGRELNPITRVLSGTTPGLVTNFALETAGIMGVSYFFHKTGHHRLERMTSLVNIGSSAFAVTYGLTHR